MSEIRRWCPWWQPEGLRVSEDCAGEYVLYGEHRAKITALEAEIARLRANNMGVKYDPQQPKPPVIHVVTPESSSGTLWAEVQRLQAVEAESARTIAHLNQAHREVSEMQQARIAKLEKALNTIADHRTQLPWSKCRRIARAALGPANLQETDAQKALIEELEKALQLCWFNDSDGEKWPAWRESMLLEARAQIAEAKSAGMKPEAL